jgi:hypothetical protein
LVSSEEGVTPAITDGASTFTDNNTTQVVQVTQNGTGKAVNATSTTGNTVEAESTGTSGTNFTLLGINRSTGGRALFGFASATTGNTIAAAGRADSTAGIGFFGQALATSGQTVGVQAEVRSASGIAGVFANTAGGPLLEGRSQGQVVFSVDGSANLTALGAFGAGGLATSGAGARFMWIPSKAAIRAGRVNGAQWDLVNIGDDSVALGLNSTASGAQATVGGGDTNVASGSHATVGGGAGNTASGSHDTVGGGVINTASGGFSTVGGGFQNSASGAESTIGGGQQNSTHALASFATVPGGIDNLAQGSRSFAAGNRAKANHNGAFVWGDSTNADVASTAANQVTFRATGGFRVVMGATPTEIFNLTSTAGASPNLVAGLANSVTSGVKGATISGGGDTAQTNQVTDDFGTVSGGVDNQAGDDGGTTSDKTGATVGGGSTNTASGSLATVGGGTSNTASGSNATVGGGAGNIASGSSATVGGGFFNTSRGTSATVAGGTNNFAGCTGTEILQPCVGLPIALDATVPGGNANHALGSYSFAAGRRAKARHAGSFVWADSTSADFASTAADQFLIRASGNVGINTASPADTLHVNGNVRLQSVNDLSGTCILNCPSDARLKKNIESVGPVLERLAKLEPVRFDWRTEEYPELHLGSARHTGLVAQQVQEALPELAGVRQDGFKTVKYHELPVLLLQAIKEQQAQIRALQAELETVKARLKKSGAVEIAFAGEAGGESPR